MVGLQEMPQDLHSASHRSASSVDVRRARLVNAASVRSTGHEDHRNDGNSDDQADDYPGLPPACRFSDRSRRASFGV